MDAVLEAISHLAYANPFLPERIDYEKQALGPLFEPGPPVWSIHVQDPDQPRSNARRIFERLEPIVGQMAQGVIDSSRAPIYEDAAHYVLYQRYYADFSKGTGFAFYRCFLDDWKRYFKDRGGLGGEPGHIFACFHQIHRAFHNIFDHIIGGSMPAARLRASTWQSIFTHDMRRYRRTLYARMRDFTTVITGPSGTGKELVARAIGLSRYLPFNDTNLSFPEGQQFHPINISALPSTLVESELFGHRKGSFTGAIADRKGWLESCSQMGTVFLDELGELDPAIQVKLLRVIETRTFHAIGDTAPREFRGKLVAATNRNLEVEIRSGRFREDLYYRMCSDQIHTPSLAEQLRESPEVLHELLLYFARRSAGTEAEALLPALETWIARELPPGYDWPGNYRELDQAVRNFLIRQSYRPIGAAAVNGGFVDGVTRGTWTAEELISRYAAMVYAKCGSYEETARRLDLDRRTVKAKVNAQRNQD